jgi:hypothetical protein
VGAGHEAEPRVDSAQLAGAVRAVAEDGRADGIVELPHEPAVVRARCLLARARREGAAALFCVMVANVRLLSRFRRPPHGLVLRSSAEDGDLWVACIEEPVLKVIFHMWWVLVRVCGLAHDKRVGCSWLVDISHHMVFHIIAYHFAAVWTLAK